MSRPVMTDEVGIFLANWQAAEITDEPELESTQDGSFSWWECFVSMSFGVPLRCRIMPICEGWDVPFHKGDRVRVVYNHGEGMIIGHYASAQDHDGHTHIGPRAGKDLRIGQGSGAWEALALHSRMAAELVGAWNAIDEILGALATADPTALPDAAAAVTAINAIKTTLGTITGGDAASRAKGQKS